MKKRMTEREAETECEERQRQTRKQGQRERETEERGGRMWVGPGQHSPWPLDRHDLSVYFYPYSTWTWRRHEQYRLLMVPSQQVLENGHIKVAITGETLSAVQVWEFFPCILILSSPPPPPPPPPSVCLSQSLCLCLCLSSFCLWLFGCLCLCVCLCACACARGKEERVTGGMNA